MGGSGQCGTFSPLLGAYKTKNERLAAIHASWTAKLSELVKEVSMYGDRLQKTHKKVKEDESATLEAVKLIQDTTGLLQKSKEVRKAFRRMSEMCLFDRHLWFCRNTQPV